MSGPHTEHVEKIYQHPRTGQYRRECTCAVKTDWGDDPQPPALGEHFKLPHEDESVMPHLGVRVANEYGASDEATFKHHKAIADGTAPKKVLEHVKREKARETAG